MGTDVKAIMQRGYGAPSRVLGFEETEIQRPAVDEVLVRVRAATLNSGDWRQVRAKPLIVRLETGLRRPKNPATGGDASGVVEAAGAAVPYLRVGDEVFGVRKGALSEYVTGKNFVRKPAGYSFEEAASLGIAALTALQAVRDHAQAKPGSRIVVNGAGGGVGSFAVQIAVALGATVTAVTATDKLEVVRQLGAHEVLDYTRDDFTRHKKSYDAVIDVAGDRRFGPIMGSLADGGRMVNVGAHRGIIRRLIAGAVRRRLLKQPIVFFIAKVSRDDLETIRDMAEQGKLKPVIGKRYEFEDAIDAIAESETQRVPGKIVISVA